MADRPTQEWLKPDTNTGTAAKTGDSLPLPNDDTLTLDASRKGRRAGESADYQVPGGFYKMTAQGSITAPGSYELIGGRHPQDGALKLDTEDEDGVYVVKPLPGARRQIVTPDTTKPIQYPEGQ